MREFGIEVRSADGGHIEKVVRLPGEVVFNADRIAHVTPTVAGIVRKVNFSVGDQVKAGQVMAVLNSRELAAARSEFLAAKARLALAEVNLPRDQRLFKEKVGTERAVLESQQAFEETRIALNQAENALHALGYSHDQIAKIETLEDTEFNTYELSSPLGGMVTARHVTVGEVIEPGNGSPFVVADLSTVWVNLTVYQRDLAHVQAGQHVTIRFGHGIPDAEGEIAFISPSLDETTRTATARIVLKNPDGHWRPGLFVEGRIETGRASASVVVPRSAITEMDGEQVVFVQTDEGFEPREVTVGRTTPESAEIVTGLKPGERFVAANVLALKAEMNRAALEHAGHAH
jgi:cobalt-zinc-cadmium efflux system membrane fusion protein